MLWALGNLQGRRTPDVPYHALPVPPAGAPAEASAVEKARATAAKKAYNRTMRPSLGTATHAIFEAYYLQKVRGAWHPPMAWLDLAEAWHTRPGQIALKGREHMPAPESLARVWCEELVLVEAPEAWAGPWPALGGTPDLVTLDHAGALHLYDYKTTLSFDYAKTAEYLRDHDEQAAIYSLAVMQEHGLESLDCTWVYMRTEGAPASHAVHFTMTRAHAEARVMALAKRALELEALTRAYVAAGAGFLGEGARLAIINAMPTNDSACTNYGGCIYHQSKGGPCKPARAGLGTAMRRDAGKAQQKQLRRETVKKERTRTHMALNAEQQAELDTLLAKAEPNFAENQKIKKLQKLAGDGSSAAAAAPKAEKPAEVEATGEDAGEAEAKPAEEAPKAEKPKPAASKPSKAPAASEGTSAIVDGFSFAVPANSALGKQLAKAAKGLQAAAAAFEGE